MQPLSAGRHGTEQSSGCQTWYASSDILCDLSFGLENNNNNKKTCCLSTQFFSVVSLNALNMLPYCCGRLHHLILTSFLRQLTKSECALFCGLQCFLLQSGASVSDFPAFLLHVNSSLMNFRVSCQIEGCARKAWQQATECLSRVYCTTAHSFLRSVLCLVLINDIFLSCWNMRRKIQ